MSVAAGVRDTLANAATYGPAARSHCEAAFAMPGVLAAWGHLLSTPPTSGL